MRQQKGKEQGFLMRRILVLLPTELIKRLKLAAVEHDMQMKEMVKIALEHYLEALEKEGKR